MTDVNHSVRGPPRNCGAASEPADSMNTIVQPEAMPGLAYGMTTSLWMRHHGAPRSRAASIWFLSRLSIAL